MGEAVMPPRKLPLSVEQGRWLEAKATKRAGGIRFPCYARITPAYRLMVVGQTADDVTAALESNIFM